MWNSSRRLKSGGLLPQIIKDFATYYLIAKKKVSLKLWSVEYAKGWLYCYLDMVLLDTSDDSYNMYAQLIDELEE